MAKIGDKIPAVIVKVNPDESREDNWGRKRFYRGDVHIEAPSLTQPMNYIILVNGSVQNVPVEDRVVGKKGFVEWVNYGNYHGWVWRSK